MSERCDHTDLLKAECAHCRIPEHCANCDEPIYQGDPLRLDDGYWVHEECWVG